MTKLELRLDNIRPRPKYIDRFPGLSPNSGTALYPNVYVGKALYENLLGVEPDPYSVALILHEQEHIARIKGRGFFRWYWRYFIRPKFRLHEELEAMKPQFAYLKHSGLPIDLEHRAKVLSGAVYLWPTSYNNALKELTKIVESV